MLWRNFPVVVLTAIWPMAALHAADVDGPSVLQGLNASQQEIQDLENGEVLVFDSEPYENTPRELAADAVILVDNDLQHVLAEFEQHVSLIPNEDMLAHAEIYNDADFTGVEFIDDDYDEVERLLVARAGKEFNFSDEEYALIEQQLSGLRRADRARQIAAASNVMRKILLGRYHAYRSAGLNGLADYKRSSRKQTSVGQELRFTSETFKPFENDFPGYYHVMVDFPDADECCKHEFRWLKVKIRDRPTFVLAHTFYQLTDEFLLITERFFYVSNSVNSLQITLAWLPYDDDTYMGISMSASADILSSMLGRMLRPLGRNKAKELVQESLIEFRDALEETAAPADATDMPE